MLDHAIIYNIYNNKLTKSKYKADIHCTDLSKTIKFHFYVTRYSYSAFSKLYNIKLSMLFISGKIGGE